MARHTTIRPSAMAALMLSIIAVAAPSGLTAEGDAVDTTGPKVIAIKFHADWCGFCKAMGTVYEELQAKFDKQPVLWLTFDLTREHQRQQAAYLAQALSLGDVWVEYGDKTGFILLIDADTRKVLHQLTHDQNLKQMGAKLEEAVKQMAPRQG